MSQSAFAKLIGRTAPDDRDIRAMAAAAWHSRGWVCLRLEDVRNEIDRMVVERAVEAIYGRRKVGAAGPRTREGH